MESTDMKLPQFADELAQLFSEQRDDGKPMVIKFATGSIDMRSYDDCCQLFVTFYDGSLSPWAHYPRFDNNEPRYYSHGHQITGARFKEILIDYADDIGEFVLWNQL